MVARLLTRPVIFCAFVARWLVLAFIAAVLVACASAAEPTHKFDFSPLQDSPQVRVLDWRYSEYAAPSWQIRQAREEGKGVAGLSATGSFPVGDHIYLKWQVPPNDQIYERRIELKRVLPSSMEGKEITVMFRAGEPYVYLISRDTQRRCTGRECIAVLSSDAEAHARSYMHGAIVQIYPGAAKKISPGTTQSTQ
jgi:hypothetical protein